ncbi:MAG: glycosyltransferase, partial [Cyanobacteria bacterium Co-bin13]|nr:glycosyltransferase [Cyanobacteria bacterium Co-bin13]
MTKSPMRIAFIVGHFPRLSETFILNQVTGLIDRGHQVDIFSEYEGNWDSVHPDVVRYNLRQHTYPLHPVPQNYLVRSLRGLGLLLTRFARAPRLMVRSLNIFKHGRDAAGLWLLYGAASLVDSGLPRYDIIHCQFGTQGHRGWFLQRVMQPAPKLIVMFRGHDISSRSYVQANGVTVYTPLFKAADYCLTNCDFFRQRLIQLGCAPERVAVHYSGLDVAKFAYTPRQISSDGVVQLVTTGRLVEKKGIEYAIRAVAQ